MHYFGGKTVNNLPLLVEVSVGGQVEAVVKVPVVALRGMGESMVTRLLERN